MYDAIAWVLVLEQPVFYPMWLSSVQWGSSVCVCVCVIKVSHWSENKYTLFLEGSRVCYRTKLNKQHREQQEAIKLNKSATKFWKKWSIRGWLLKKEEVTQSWCQRQKSWGRNSSDATTTMLLKSVRKYYPWRIISNVFCSASEPHSYGLVPRSNLSPVAQA